MTILPAIINERAIDAKKEFKSLLMTFSIFGAIGFVMIMSTTLNQPVPPTKASTIGQEMIVNAKEVPITQVENVEPKGEEIVEPVKQLGYNESEGSIKVEELKAVKKSQIKNDCASPNKNLEKAINQVAVEVGIDCRYLITLARIESGENPNSKNTGCTYYKVYKKTICENSYGGFMINLDAHGKTVTKAQALDPLFATRWAAKRIVGQYGGKPDSNGQIKGWIGKLSCHQGKWGNQCGSNDYRSKVEKTGLSTGLKY